MHCSHIFVTNASRHPPVTPLRINMPQDKQCTKTLCNPCDTTGRQHWPSTKTVAHAALPAVPKHGRGHLDTAQKGRSEKCWISGSPPKNSRNLHRRSNGDKSTDKAMHCGLRYGFMLTGSWWPHAQESKYTCFMPVILMVCNTMSNFQLCAPGGFSNDMIKLCWCCHMAN